MIERLQYISQAGPNGSHGEVIERICQAGIRWVQLRVKDASVSEVRRQALKVKEVCTKFGVKYILNDYVELAAEVGADGVHLGKTDMDPLEARALLGPGKIIGGTANTIDDIRGLVQKKVDYIGLGPLRYTATKKNLSPVLGQGKYKEIMDQMKQERTTIPIVAIGGIVPEDVSELMDNKVFGIATGSSITSSEDPEQVINLFNQLITNGTTQDCRNNI